MQVVICVEVYKRLGRSLKLRLEKVSSMLQRKIQERLTNGEVKGKGEVVEIRASSPLFYEYFSHILPYFTFISDY